MFLRLLKLLWEWISKMKWPIINKYPARNVTIPKLCGGLNTRDAVNLVNDNQLTDSLNVWYKDNFLKTRPALQNKGALEYSGVYPTVGGITYTKLKSENAKKNINGVDCSLVSRHTSFYSKVNSSDTVENPQLSHIQFYWVGAWNYSNEDYINELPSITSNDQVTYTNYFVVQFNSELYCFCQINDESNSEAVGEIYKLSADSDEWEKLTEEDMYIPTIMTNCKTSGWKVDSQDDLLAMGATMVDGFNILTPYYKMIYSTVNESMPTECQTSSETVYGNWMSYSLLHPFTHGTLKVKITDKNGAVHIHTVTNNGAESVVEATASTDRLYMNVEGRTVNFSPIPAIGSAAAISVEDLVRNNMEIIAPFPDVSSNLDKVFGMTQSVWFGGDALGLSSGTRLFLGGNNVEKDKSLVIWSDINQPLYFSENCYAYVGDKEQSVTAFGRQNESLIIFKERETFYTQYTQNNTIVADDLINQTIIDYTALSVYFPMIQLHAAIGCDCPNTVQLCRNYLVWANSDGRVYTLRSQNQFSERNIYCVSDMITRKLKDEINKNAGSVDWDGHYCLFCGNSVFVMDYDSYGYVNASSYYKTADAQLLIPWWYWQIDENLEINTVLLADGSPWVLLTPSMFNESADISVLAFNENERLDNGTAPIKSSLTTKIFDFGAPGMTKKIPLVNIAFGEKGFNPVNVSFVTDNGTERALPSRVYGGVNDEYSAEYIENRQFRPTKIATRFGIKIEREGNLSVDSISLDYRILGGVK